jgi:hypothetical protein
MLSCAAATEKFVDPEVTADGAARARAPFAGLKTLWVNTGTLCNIECAHCYIESSPKNDRFVYLTRAELAPFLDEAEAMGAREVGFTGGEPFLNPHMTAMAEDALRRGFEILILTNALRPMMRPRIRDELLGLRQRFGGHLRLRVSLDSFSARRHDEERGAGNFAAVLDGLRWLLENHFPTSIAGRTRWNGDEAALRDGYAALFRREDFSLNAHDPKDLVLFPEMDARAAVPEITEQCWEKLGVSPSDMMCASARMIVKRKGAAAPAVLSCTLLAYDAQFEMGATLAEAARPVSLNHPHCATFCVLGGASCSG